MDKILAEIYGTNQVDETDLEKAAAAQLADQLADGGELDMSAFTPEQLEELAQEVLNEAQDASGATEDAGTTEEAASLEEEEALAKVAEADRLGRVMAHSMWQELGEIQKEASAGKVMGHLRRGAQAVGRAAETVGSKLTPNRLSDAAYSSAKIKSMRQARKGGASMADLKKSMTQHSAKGHSAVSNLHKGVGAGAAALGAGGLAAGVSKMTGGKKKKASALDTLAEARALQILENSGIDPNSLAPVTEKQASGADEALEQAVNQRAWEILAEFGVVPEGQE